MFLASFASLVVGFILYLFARSHWKEWNWGHCDTQAAGVMSLGWFAASLIVNAILLFVSQWIVIPNLVTFAILSFILPQLIGFLLNYIIVGQMYWGYLKRNSCWDPTSERVNGHVGACIDNMSGSRWFWTILLNGVLMVAINLGTYFLLFAR